MEATAQEVHKARNTVSGKKTTFKSKFRYNKLVDIVKTEEAKAEI